MAASEHRRQITAEIAPKVSDLISGARKRFRILAVTAAINALALGVGLGMLMDAPTRLGIVGGVIGFVVFLAATNWGQKLDQSPRGLHLVKARTGAAMCLAVVPLAPLIAWPLLRRLGHPVLVKHAVTNHPDSGKMDDEALIATIRVRSAFVTLRTTGFLLLAASATLVVIYSTLETSKMIAAAAAVVVGLVAVVQIAAGLAATRILLEMPPDAERRVGRWTMVLMPLVPFGTYAAWSARRAFALGRGDASGP